METITHSSSMVDYCIMKAALALPTQPNLLAKAREILQKIPSVMFIDNLKDAQLVIKDFFPEWTDVEIVNIASIVYKAPGGRLNPDSTTFEKGQFAIGSPYDVTLPKPIDPAKAETMWSRYEWDECMRESNLKRLIDVGHYDGCKFDMLMEGEHGAMLSLRSFPPSPLAIGAIIKLHPDINDVYCIGELIAEGEMHLREGGPEKQSVALGITDLKKIRWFHLTLHEFLAIARSLIIADARESICGYLHTLPVFLGVNMALNIHRLPSSWKLLKYLGSGLTSCVYLVADRSGSRFAVKTPRLAFDLHADIQYLELLRAVDGVPVIQEKIHRMIALKPVCDTFSAEAFFTCETLSLADLVETLQCAHERGIVNRDLTPSNIMIGESLYNPGKIRFFILDWGCAAKVGSSTEFAGSVATASDQVLRQLCAHGFTKVVVSASDDLVSLVRCLFLIFDRKVISVVCKMKKQREKIIHFWQQQIEKSSFWRKAQGHALQLQYDGLKELFQMSTQGNLMEV